MNGARRSRVRGLLAASLLTLLVLVPAVSPGAVGAARSDRFSGERARDVGPRTAPVDPAHATVGAARRAAARAHHHGSGGPTVSSMGTSVTSATSATSGMARTSGTLDATDPAPTTPDPVLDPSVYGQWSTVAYPMPVRAIHVTLLRTGKLLLIAGSGNVASEHVVRNFAAYLWDPGTGEMTSVPVPDDAFCSGHVVDAAGDVLVFGGTLRYDDASGPWEGSDEAWKFRVDTSTWKRLPSMRQGRWYPTVVENGKGRSLVYSGKDATGATPSLAERYDATSGWSRVADRRLPLYPGLGLLRGGRLLYAGSHFGGTHAKVAPQRFDPSTGERTFVGDPHDVIDVTHRNGAMSALVGSADKQLTWVAGGGFPAVRSTYFIDANAATLTAVPGPRLPAAKAYLSVSDLPDLTALETGGGTATNSPVHEASILDPVTRRLTPVAPPSVGRTYHSSAITLPDGRVVTFGGDPSGDDTFELRAEIYSPPYLFKGPRPTLTAPTELRYGRTYGTAVSTATGSRAASAVLLRPGSATHSLDANQRVLRLTATVVAGGLSVRMPSNPNLAPPGWYLLFANDTAGRPSVGRWVHLTA